MCDDTQHDDRARRLWEAVYSFVGSSPVMSWMYPRPPEYEPGGAPTGGHGEADIHPVREAYARLDPAPDSAVAAVYACLCEWAAGQHAHALTGHDLALALAVELGLCPGPAFDDADTDPVWHAYRPDWDPDVDADADRQGAELAAGVAALRRLLDREEFADLVAAGDGLIIDASHLRPPLTLDAEQLSDPDPAELAPDVCRAGQRVGGATGGGGRAGAVAAGRW